MPELWLKFGPTYIVLDVKYENLNKHIYMPNQKLDFQYSDLLNSFDANGNILIVLLKSTQFVLQITKDLVNALRSKGIMAITIDYLTEFHKIKDMLADICITKKINYLILDERIKEFDHIVFISESGFDPLFGFQGTPIDIIRSFYPQILSNCYSSRRNNMPMPGIFDKPTQIATDTFKDSKYISIEITRSNQGIHISFGNIIETFKESIELLKCNIIQENKTKSLITSVSSDDYYHLTLNESLYSLFNVIDIVEPNGSIYIVCENSLGLGSTALQQLVEGRLKLGDLNSIEHYINGLENLLYLSTMSSLYDIGIVSSLPEFYLRKLNLSSFENLDEIMKLNLKRYGNTNRITVISDSDKLLIKSSSKK